MGPSSRQWLLAVLCTASIAQANAALVVEGVRSNQLEPRVGLEAGDVLEAAILPSGERVALSTCADWRAVELGALPAKSVELSGTRAGEPQRWTLRESEVQLAFVVDAMPPAQANACRLREAFLKRDDAAALATAEALASDATHVEPAQQAWVLRDRAELAVVTSHPDLALTLLDELIALPDLPRNLDIDAWLLRSSALRDLKRQPEARESAARGVALAAANVVGSVLHGRALLVDANLRDVDASLDGLKTAIAVLEGACRGCRELGEARFQRSWKLLNNDRDKDGEMLALAEQSLATFRGVESVDATRRATRLMQLAQIANSAGEPRLGEEIAREALAIAESGPVAESVSADALHALSGALHLQGRLRDALAASRRSYDIIAQLTPDSADRAKHNLGLILADLGDLDAAERAIGDSLQWMLGAAPGSLDEARVRRSMASVFEQQGDYESALREIDAAIAIERALGASGELFANTLLVKGRVQVLTGNTHDAARTLDESLAAYQVLFEGDCLCLGAGLLGVGWLEVAVKRPVDALARFEQARAIYAKAVPTGSPAEGEALLGQGEAWLLQDKPANALRALDRATAVLQRDAPDQATLALALNARARARQQSGNAAGAASDYCAAADVLQRAGRRVGSDSLVQAVFRDRHAEIFRDCIEATLRGGDTQAALLRLEATRSRTFLDALATREIDLLRRAPGQRGVLARLDEANRERERIQHRLADFDVQPAERKQLESELVAFGKARAAAASELRRVAPEIAALEGASIESIAALEASLPRGAVALEYSVGIDETLLFVVKAGAAVQVHRIAFGRAALAERVTQFRKGILRRDPAEIGALREAGGALFELLLAPARERIDEATLLLVSPDGPLFDLPYAALWDPRAMQYAGVHWPLVFSDSLTTWTHLHNRKPGVHTGRRLAVADADTVSLLASPALPRADEIAALPPLPGARVEVRALQATAPALTDVLLGVEANEARVRADASKPALLHFAVHALLDARNPLDSALVLGHTGAASQSDGLLHVGEVVEELDLAADLVVLSGCDTARGEALQGEGLIGFTRAFEFAGADAVMASLWPVSDRPTADFMERFYRALAAGDGTARALQRAIVDTTNSSRPLAFGETRGVGALAPRATTVVHPYVWAGFQLYGGAQ